MLELVIKSCFINGDKMKLNDDLGILALKQKTFLLEINWCDDHQL